MGKDTHALTHSWTLQGAESTRRNCRSEDIIRGSAKERLDPTMNGPLPNVALRLLTYPARSLFVPRTSFEWQ